MGLWNYSYGVIALGTGLLALASAVAGCVTVERGRGLIGDALGHSTFPGVIIAFMVLSSRNVTGLMVGSALAAIVATWVIGWLGEDRRMEKDGVLAIVLSGFFGLGLVLKSYISGNAAYQGATQAGLSSYIFGQAAYILERDVLLISAVAIVVLALLGVFYRPLSIFLFDDTYAETVGISSRAMEALILGVMIALISVGLKVVGAILISSFLIIPAVSAKLWTKTFPRTMALAAVFAVASSLVGSAISMVVPGMSTGPVIVLIMGSLALVSLFVSPNGILASRRRREALK